MLSPFDTRIQCEDYFSGYEVWSDELQAEFEAANETAQTVQTERGAMLIPRECVHSECKSIRCRQGLRTRRLRFMKCLLCSLPILTGEEVHQHHHKELKSRGGTETAPVHGHCHQSPPQHQGRIQKWGSKGGKQTASTPRWTFNLRNVRTHPAYDFDRQYYLALYAH